MENKLPPRDTKKERKNYYNRKNTAKKKGIDFEITLEEFLQLRTVGICGYTGKTLSMETKDREHKWSLDRRDNLKGYTMDNVVVCSEYINMLKAQVIDEKRPPKPELQEHFNTQFKPMNEPLDDLQNVKPKPKKKVARYISMGLLAILGVNTLAWIHLDILISLFPHLANVRVAGVWYMELSYIAMKATSVVSVIYFVREEWIKTKETPIPQRRLLDEWEYEDSKEK